jgi:hypothetical protein
VADQAVAENDVARFREARRAERSGTPLSPTPPADSSPAPDASADSSSVKPEKKPAGHVGNADTRVAELLAERAQLRAELEHERRQRSQPQETRPTPASEPAPASPETFPSYDTYLQTHPDASYETYLDERSDFRVQKGVEAALKADREKAAKEQTRHAITKGAQERQASFAKQIEDAETATPGFRESLHDDVKRLPCLDDVRDPATGQFTTRPTPYHWIGQRILESPQATSLLRHFSDHPEDLHRIARLAPDDAVEAFVELRLQVTGKAAPPAPTPKTVTSAPPPAIQLGNRPAVPSDPIDSAVASGDVRAYREARLRQRTANLR